MVKIPFTVLDVFQTIARAKLHGKSIGVIAFSPMIRGLDRLGTMLGTSIRFYPLENPNDVEPMVIAASEDNVDIIVGGAVTRKAANKYKIPFAVIESSFESFQQAAQEARNIELAKQQEKAKGNLFRVVLNYAYDGIISVNAQGQFTIFNPVAERVTQMNYSLAIGRHIQEVWPDLEVHKVLSSGKENLAQLLTINNSQVVCNKVPIYVNNKIVGAAINFQDVTKLQQMEAKVRRRLFATGHVANLCFDDIIGKSPQLLTSVTLAKDFAKTDSAILIQGETGTGKEVFAQSMHNGSSRSHAPFVALNCAALPEQILESELFGYAGGAFTGANKNGKAGLFEIAHGGTLFLDEIAEMRYLTQGKLLRVLQEKKVKFSNKAQNELKNYNWPGNVRELQNVIERILATMKTKEISAEMVRQHFDTPYESEIRVKLLNNEMEEIKQALIMSRGNHTEAAKVLGISRSTLWRKLKKITL